MLDYYSELVTKYRTKGVLVDTNLLLLLLIGRFDRDRIRRFKNTSAFTVDDYDLLEAILGLVQRFVTTPHILTEVSNLSSQLGDPVRSDLFAELPAMLAGMEEYHVAFPAACSEPCFTRLGLTDSAVVQLVVGRYLVVTTDADLYIYLDEVGGDVINFSHIRPLWE